jgi:hypothetical protein
MPASSTIQFLLDWRQDLSGTVERGGTLKVLRLEWMMTAPDDNSGVFVAFPDPEQQNYDNTAYVGINFGFEVQIDELARPDNALIHRTGAIYSDRWTANC